MIVMARDSPDFTSKSSTLPQNGALQVLYQSHRHEKLSILLIPDSKPDIPLSTIRAEVTKLHHPHLQAFPTNNQQQSTFQTLFWIHDQHNSYLI